MWYTRSRGYLDTCLPGTNAYVGAWRCVCADACIPGLLISWIEFIRGYVDTWIRRCVDTWMAGYVACCYVDTWTRGYVDAWLPGWNVYVDTWISGHVDTLMTGYVD